MSWLYVYSVVFYQRAAAQFRFAFELIFYVWSMKFACVMHINISGAFINVLNMPLQVKMS